jgi:hypothetical protein
MLIFGGLSLSPRLVWIVATLPAWRHAQRLARLNGKITETNLV